MRLFSELTSLQKTAVGILCILLAAVVSLDVSIYRCLFVNPYTYQTTYKKLTSDKLPSNMDQVSIVYMTDLEYGDFSDPDQVQEVFDTIHQLDPDLFLFGGDLFDWNYTPSAKETAAMTEWLSGIEAPLGKFAVYGEQDIWQESTRNMVDEIYDAAQIEVLDNSSLNIGNHSRFSLKLIGLSPEADIESAFKNASAEQFNLVLSHYPDNLLQEEMALHPVSYAFAGDAHGTQVTWPIIGGYKQWRGAERLNRASEKNLNFPYYISSGLGCIDVHARLNSPCETVYILLESR